MRVKKAGINVVVNVITYLLGFIPSLIVRKIFLDNLGNELLGLSSLYTNIIGLLSIVELGIGTAIIFSLYKPYAEDDRVKIKGYLNYYAKFYKIVGIVIFIAGILLLPFLKLFIKNEVTMGSAQVYFVLFLINTVITYFFSYKICLLNVAQEGYKVSVATTISKLIIAILQVLVLKLYPSFTVYIIIQIVINITYYIWINCYINNRYTWLKNTDGSITVDEKKHLTKNVKALFLHKIGSMVVFSTDSLIISSFINLQTVGKYNSYNMIINAVQGLIGNALGSITASIGNLLAEKDKESAYEVHKRLFFANFWIVSFITISLSNTLEQFIRLWLGNSQVIDRFTVSIILINFYFVLMRGSVEGFKDGSGNYHQDRFAPLFESGINLISSIILVKIIGLPGVFLGTLISNFSVVFWVKPKITYKYVFDKGISDYFKMYFKYLLITLIPLVITYFLTVNLKDATSMVAFIGNCLINVVVINVIYLILFWRNNEFLYYKQLVINMLKRDK